MPTLDTIKVYCFVKSQNPSRESDYRYFTQPDFSTYPSSRPIKDGLDALFISFAKEAKTMPGDYSVLWFPILDPESGETYSCLARVEIERNNGPREYVRLMAVAALTNDWENASIGPENLYNQITWTEEALRNPVDEIQIPRLSSSQMANLSKKFLESLEDGLGPPKKPIEDPGGRTNIIQILSGIKEVLRDIGWNRYQKAFAVRVPTPWKPPSTVPFDLIVQEPKDLPLISSSITSEMTRTQPSPTIAPRLKDIADALERDKGISDVWRYRLWNICQDLIEAEGLCQEAAHNIRRSLDREMKSVNREYERLNQGFERAHCKSSYGDALNKWRVQFKQSYSSMPDKNGASRFSLNRLSPLALAVCASALIVLALVVWAVYTFVYIPYSKSQSAMGQPPSVGTDAGSNGTDGGSSGTGKQALLDAGLLNLWVGSDGEWSDDKAQTVTPLKIKAALPYRRGRQR